MPFPCAVFHRSAPAFGPGAKSDGRLYPVDRWKARMDLYKLSLPVPGG